LLDAALDAVMLGIAARLGGMRIRPERVICGALAGALCAWLARKPALSRGAAALVWLPTALIMQMIAQGKAALVHPMRNTLLLLCAAGLLGGTLTALAGATGSLVSAYALGGVCMAVMTMSLARAGRAVGDTRRALIVCRYRGRTARFEAMIDSGNTLRDYLTHRPVIVMPTDMGKRLFHLREAPLRPIFADTAGGRQMMELLVPQETEVMIGGRRTRVEAAVALCGALSKHAPALAPASLTDGLWK